jgi:type II secretory pathway pseudopilin PulG
MPREKPLTVRAPRLPPNSQSGLSYIEVLVATILVALSLVPAVEALRGGIFGASVHEAAAADHYALMAKMEEVLAEPYPLLDTAAVAAGSESTPASYSDSAGAPKRRLVYLSRYDADVPGFTATDTGLLWVRVEFESRPGALRTLTAR